MERAGINSIAEIVLLRVTLRCNRCGNEWGIKTYSIEELLLDVENQKKLVCFRCKFGAQESEGDHNGYKEK